MKWLRNFNMMPTHLYKHSQYPPIFFHFLFFYWIDLALRERKSLLINESWKSHCFTWKMAEHQTQRPALEEKEETNNSTSWIGQENRVMLFFLLETWAHLIPSLLFSLWILPSVSFAQSWLSVDFFFTVDCNSNKDAQKDKTNCNPSPFLTLIPMSR